MKDCQQGGIRTECMAHSVIIGTPGYDVSKALKKKLDLLEAKEHLVTGGDEWHCLDFS